MRHFRHSTAFAALAASAFATFASAQTPNPLAITDARADYASSEGTYPNATAITAGVTGVTLTVTGSGFVFSYVTAGPQAPQSTLLWVPASGACPVSSCEFTIYPLAPGEFGVFSLPDALFANADLGAAIRVKNPDNTLSAPHPMPVNPPMANVPLPTGYRNFPYRGYFTSGGTPPYFLYSESPDGVPGMNLAAAQQGGGIITGAPSEAGSYSLLGAVYDLWGLAPPSEEIHFDVSEFPAAFVGRPYLIRNPFVSAEVFTPSVPAEYAAFVFNRNNRAGATFTARVESGSLPPGLSLTLSSDVLSISGTPTAPGSYVAEILVSDAQGMPVAAGNVEIVVLQAVVIVTEALPPMPDSGTYDVTLRAINGVPPYMWTVSSGSLPAGLSLNPATGVISGETGAMPTLFTVTVTDAVGTSASQTYRLLYAIRITTETLPNGKTGENYSAVIDVVGGSGQYGLRVVSGSLPPGLTLYETRVLRGGPTKAGSYTFTVELTDRVASLQTPFRQEYTIVIAPRNLTITTRSPLPETPAGPISVTFDASGGAPPYIWGAGAGLPPGTSLSSGGLLNGTANTPGAYSFTVTVTDSAKTAVSETFALRIGPAPLTITTSTLPSGAVTEQYSSGLTATGGTPPYAWTASGLPSGVTAAAAGTIEGMPAGAGNFTVQLQVTDSAGISATKTVALAVAIRTLAVQTASLADATAGSPYTAALSATGGVPPYRWTLSGTPPAGITLSSEGVLAGTPRDAGLYPLTVQATDAQGATASRPLSLRVNNRPLVITTTALPPGTAGSAYNYMVAATGGLPPFTWSGSLPAGLQIAPGTGAITGTPAAGGSLIANVTVTDSAGGSTSRVYTVQVDMPAPPVIDFGSIPGTANPLAQPPLTLSLGSAYPLPITGTVSMSFAPDSGPDDPNVVFSTGGRTTSYTVPAGSTSAGFSVPNLAFQAGTVAGVITITLTLESGGQDITPSPAPSRQIRIAPAAPAITSVTLASTSGGFAVQVTGYSTIREVTQAVFRLSPAAGANLQTTELTVPVSSLFGAWYGSAASPAYGSQFLFTQNFNVQGSGNAIASVTVTLTNSQGSSQPMSATF